MTASRAARGWPGRRPLLGAALALPAARVAAAAAPPPHAGWESFVARHLRPEGRMVNAAAGGISHSGGQAWTMLIAERFGDRRSFDAVLGWTRAALMRRPDHLLCWRWNPASGAVEDANNTTDADLCFAWALLRADARWPGQGYRSLARAVAADIRRHLLLPVAGRLVLLPGAWRFEAAEEVVLKPSHYVFPALDALARAFPNPAWPRLIADGERLCEEARFGRWGLPADRSRCRAAAGRRALGAASASRPRPRGCRCT
jgi:endoglucanase